MNIKPGTKVRHPSRGDGVVSTVSYAPLTGKPKKAWVEFGFAPGATRKFECWAADLTVVDATAERSPPQVPAGRARARGGLAMDAAEHNARDLGGSAGRVTMALDADLEARKRAHMAIAGLPTAVRERSRGDDHAGS